MTTRKNVSLIDPIASLVPLRPVWPARRRSVRPGQQYLPVDATNVGVPAKSHRQLELAVDDFEAARDAGLAHRTEAVQEGTTDQHAAGTEGPRLQHVLAGTDATVHPDLDARADRLGDPRKRLDRGRRTIELTPAVVRDDQRIGAAVDSQTRVLDIEDSLQDQLAAPQLLHPLDVGPAQGGIELLLGPGAQR